MVYLHYLAVLIHTDHQYLIQLDKLVGLMMLIVATTVFLYYTTWTLLMVCSNFSARVLQILASSITAQVVPSDTLLMFIFQPFVDQGHPLHDLFPPRVWAIRIPVILILLGSAVVGSFLSVVMIRSTRKKAAKARAVEAGKKKA